MEKLINLLKTISMILASLTSLGYEVESTVIKNYDQTVYTILVDTTNRSIAVTSDMAKEQVYGFERTSSISKRNKALVGINGMYYGPYGEPLGILMIDGEWQKIQDIGAPVLIIERNGNLQFKNLVISASIKIGGKSYQVDSFNTPLKTGIGLYSKAYGSNNRVEGPQITFAVKDNRISKIHRNKNFTKIKQDYLITIRLGDKEKNLITSEDLSAIKLGDEVIIDFQAVDNDSKKPIDTSNWQDLVQTGGYLVFNGKNVAKDYEPYIGHTSSLQPRTAVGINEQGKLIFIIVDGRQKGYSIGLTNKSLADVFIAKTCKYAASLDGGISSTLIIKDELINRPSLDEENKIIERQVGHSFLIFRHIDKIKALYGVY